MLPSENAMNESINIYGATHIHTYTHTRIKNHMYYMLRAQIAENVFPVVLAFFRGEDL